MNHLSNCILNFIFKLSNVEDLNVKMAVVLVIQKLMNPYVFVLKASPVINAMTKFKTANTTKITWKKLEKKV